MKAKSVFVIALLFIAIICVPQFAMAQSYSVSMGEVYREEGIASWYGPDFDGRPTASGEIFNAALFTAAHPTLPFGTFLLVTNKLNNRQITVKVNDRGPFVAGRSIDVSKAAAEHLDMLSTGTAPVIIETLPTNYVQIPAIPEPEPEPPPAEAHSSLPPIVVTVFPPSAESEPEPIPPVTYNPPPPVQQQPNPYPPAQYYPPMPPPPVQPAPDPYPPAAYYPPPPAQPLPEPYPPASYYPPVILPPIQNQPKEPYPPIIILQQQPPAQTTPAYETLPPVVSGAKLIPAINPAPEKVYRLQVGSYKVPRNAVDAFDKLKSAGLNPSYEQNGEYYRVVLTGVRGIEVQSVADKLERAGFKEALIKEDK